MRAALSQLERDISRISQLVRRLEEMTVPSAAKLLKKSPKWVRENLPVIVHGPKSHHVRATDIQAYQVRRMVRPKLEGRELAAFVNGNNKLSRVNGRKN